MKTRMKTWLGALLLAGGLAGGARAATIESLTVTITPVAAYSLTITTDTPSLDLGSVGLNTSTQTAVISTITITSSFATTNLDLQGVMACTGGGCVPWTFAANTASALNDELSTWAVFTDTSVVSAPAVANYFVGTTPGAAGSNVVDTTSRLVGGTAGTGLFITGTTGTAGYKTMSNLAPFAPSNNWGGRAHLWMYFTLPPTTTDNTPKRISFVLTAHS